MALPAFELACIPAGCMFLFTLVGLGVHCPEALVGALQHFAAGILLCTIGTELLPTMDLATGGAENAAACVGFFAGVAVMLMLGVLIPEAHGHDDDDDDDHGHGHGAHEAEKMEMEPPPRRLNGRGESKKRMSFRLASSVSGMGEAQPLRLSSSSSEKAQFPAVLLFAIAVDGCMDGLLIGIATAAGPSAGPMMAASLSVEMAFLGITLAMGLKQQARGKSLGAAVVGPLAIIVGAMLGGVLADALAHNPVYLTCLLSFGTSALLFMVAEELLLEAHEKGEHVWWVDLQLYTGFYASILMGKALG